MPEKRLKENGDRENREHGKGQLKWKAYEVKGQTKERRETRGLTNEPKGTRSKDNVVKEVKG